MNIVRSFRKDSFKEFLNAIRNGDLDKVKSTFNQEFLNKRILDEPNGLRPIHVACENDSVEIVKYLMDRGCDFEQRTNESLLPIHIASSTNSVSVVDFLLKKKNQLEMETKEKYKPVHYACKFGNVDVLLLLINHKCNITCQTINGYTPLHLACESSQTDIVRILLTYNCPIDVVAKNGIRPVDLAKNHKEILALLAEKNCLFDFKGNDYCGEIDLDVDNLDNYGVQIFKCVRERNSSQFNMIYDYQKPIMNDIQTELTLMEFAITEKAYEFVEKILDVNVTNEKFEKYFVHFKEKNADIFHRILEEYIIYRSIRFNAKTELKSISIINQNCILTGSSFFELAVKYGSLDIIDQLIKKLLVRNENTWNKVKKIAEDNLNYETFKLISDREKYLETRNEALWTRLHIAVDDNEIDLLKYLLKTESELPISNYCLASVGSPLNLAAISGRIECMKLLLPRFSKVKNSLHILINNGMSRYCLEMIHLLSDINDTDDDCNTLLHLSTKFLSIKLCNALLEKGADPNIINNNGNTPLHEMVSFNFPRMKQIESELFTVTKLLLSYKTDINIKNNEDKSIFQECLQLKNLNLILTIADNQDNIQLTRQDLKIIMDNNWIEVLELVLPQCLNANQFIDEEMLAYFLNHRSSESFHSTWFLADPDMKKTSVQQLLWICALENKVETFAILSEEMKCDDKLFANGETLLTNLLNNNMPNYALSLVNSNLSWPLVNQSNNKKDTPLHVAARKEYYNLLENMLYIAEDINEENCDGDTALSILINSSTSSDEVERLAKLIISKSVIINHDCLTLMKFVENCRNLDLKTKLTKLYKKEIQRKSQNEEIKNICSVCMDNVINISFGCGHTSCNECADRMKICPICRSQIRCRNSLFL